MAEISIWKRVGGWLRRSHEPIGPNKVVRLDAEGLLVEPHPDNDQPGKGEAVTNLPARTNKKEQQLQAMEDGFNRLVEVLESIDNHVLEQREHNTQLRAQMEHLLNTLPESAIRQTDLLQKLSEELRGQTFSQQQLAETISSLPDLTQNQLDKLNEIARHVETSSEQDLKLNESFNRLDNSTQTMAQNSTEQTVALTNLAQAVQQGDENVRKMLARQNRRFFWFAGFVLVLIAALIVAAVVLAPRLGAT